MDEEGGDEQCLREIWVWWVWVLGVEGKKEKKKKEEVLGLVSLDIRGWKKKIIIKNNKVKAALTQSMRPTKSKFFWVVKVENKCQTCHLKKF